jgi:hypothetical protein
LVPVGFGPLLVPCTPVVPVAFPTSVPFLYVGCITTSYASHVAFAARGQSSYRHISKKTTHPLPPRREKKGGRKTDFDTNTLQRRVRARRNGRLRRTLMSKGRAEGLAHGLDVVFGDTEAGGAEPDLLDEVADLGGGETHVFMHVVHGRVAFVFGVCPAELGAAEEGGEVGVEVHH